MIRKTIILGAAACLICLPSLVSAAGCYAAGGFGYSDRGLAVAADITVKEKLLTVSGRYLRIFEPEMSEWDGLFALNHRPSESADDIALLAGISTPYTHGLSATLELGIGYANTVTAIKHYYGWEPGEPMYGMYYERSVKHNWGLAFQGQLFYRRVGLIVMGNHNHGRSFFAVLLSLRFVGKLN
jgi:hypothetical protein